MKAMKVKESCGQSKRRMFSTFKDPYLPWGGKRETLTCRLCHAIYYHKRWYLKDELLPAEAHKTSTGLIICPACRKIQDRFPGGVVTLRGDFLKTHKEQILHLVRNEEARAKEINPLERIISVKDLGDCVEIQTTGERFAQRVGREIHRACKGEIAYHWSEDDKFVRVEWHRGEEIGHEKKR